ncbi:MAG TPA: hypothetical protein DCS09_08865 [Porphyromonadaceae bacterium]|nr:hypothetical protein [Porphyromonadaceae bacterium]
MKPEKSEVVTPKPYFKISFGCSNRKFYDVKNLLYQIADDIDIEIQDGYIDEKCDYEGDLEEIILFRGEREDKLVSAVLDHYGLTVGIPADMSIHLSIF